MVDQVQTIRIVVDARGARSGSDEARRALRDVRDETQRAATAMERMERQLGFFGTHLRAMGAALAGLVGFDRIIQAADAFTEFSNSLKVAGIQGEALAAVQSRLYTAANKSGVEVGALGQVFSRLSMSGKELGASQADILKFTDGVTAALRVQGGSAESASGALLQLSQAMGAGTVRAEEFNSILEGALPIAQAAARGMDGMGGSVAKLRTAVTEGKVSSQQFFDGLLKGFEYTKVQAESASLTIKGALTGMQNSFERFVGSIDQATGASNGLVSGINSLSKAMENLGKMATAAKGDVVSLLMFAANPSATLASALFGKTPVETMTSQIDDLKKKIAEAEGRLQRDPGRGADVRLRTQWSAQLEALERQRAVAAVGGKAGPAPADDPDNIGLVIKRATPPPIPTKEAISAAKKYAEYTAELELAVAAQNKMTEAAGRGDVAFQEQEATLQAQQKLFDIFNVKLDESDSRLREVRDRLLEIAQGKAAEAFAVATTEMQQQNVVLEAQIRLMGEAPEIQAREIALIKAKFEAQKAGKAISAEQVEDRRQAIEQNERLKQQAEQLRQANEMWTEPLKNALRSIQGTAADAFETMLESGKISFESLGQVFGRTIRRMAAEFLALATIRPVMSVLVSGMVGGGMMTPAAAAQAGYPTSISGGMGGGLPSLGMPGGGGGLGNIFGSMGGSDSWLGRQVSGVSGWLNSPIFGIGGSVTPGAVPASEGAYAFADLSGAYGGLGGASAPTGALGGLTWGSALGGVASIGMGAMNAFSGKGTGSTIGGIAQMVGGAMMFIPGLQPFGAALSLLGGLGGMLDGGGPKIPPMPDLGYSVGPVINAGAPGVVSDLIRRTGGSGIAGRLYGGSVGGGTTHVWDGSQWQGQQYSQAYLVGPDGSSQMISGTGANVSQQDAADKLAFQIFRSDVMKGAVEGISGTLAKIFEKLTEGTVQAAADAVDFATAYDRIGKTANPAKDAIDALNREFADLSSKAEGYGLALEPLDAELAKRTKRTAQDWIDSMLDPLAVQMRALADEHASALASAEYIRDHVEGVYVDMDRIATYYTNKEAALRDQFYQGGIATLQNVIARMTYGDLANASPTLQLSGTQAAYMDALARAQGGDPTAIANLGGLAEAYVSTGRQNYASSPQFQTIVESVRQALQEIVIAQTGGSTATAGAPTAQMSVVGQQMAQQTAVIGDLVSELQKERRENAELRELMRRLLGK